MTTVTAVALPAVRTPFLECCVMKSAPLMPPELSSELPPELLTIERPWPLPGGACLPDTPEARLRLAAATSMASTLAQELNQPLTAAASSLAACARRLRKLGDDFADIRAMLDHASQETLKAGDIVRRTRNFVVSGRISADRENLRTMVERAILMLGERRDAVGLTTEVPLDLFVQADRIPLEQALTNLLLNACVALAGRADGWIELDAARTGDGQILLAVSDNGPGLVAPAEDGVAQTANAPDFGLAVTRLIVEAHGGTLEAATRPAGGARFEVTLPAA
jgi:two-component system sensor kinase FixL